MPPRGSRPSTGSTIAALARLQRYSVELDQVARTTLAFEGAVPNVDVEVLSAVARADQLSPTDLAEAIDRPRSTTSRAIARLAKHGLLERGRRSDDGRRADLRLTPSGRVQVARFADALADFFVAGQATVKEAMLLLGHDPEDTPRGGGMEALELAGLLTGVGAAFVTEVTPAVRSFGITSFVERFAVVLLADRGQVRPSQLADELVLTPPGVTSLLDRLEAEQLVNRQQGVVIDDGRGVIVRLTPRGSQAARVVEQVFRRHADEVITALARTLTLTR